MNSTTIVQTNQKGQIVIPKNIRAYLGITPNVPLHLLVTGKNLTIFPIKNIVHETENSNSYLSLLEKTQGSWGKTQNQETSELELTASNKRKSAW